MVIATSRNDKNKFSVFTVFVVKSHSPRDFPLLMNSIHFIFIVSLQRIPNYPATEPKIW